MDIIAGEVHRISLDDDAENYEKHHDILSFDDDKESVGAIALTKDNNKILVCSKYGVCTGDFTTKKIEYLVKYPHSEEQARRLRSNDGIIDPWGNLWIGVMTDFPVTKDHGVSKEGFLYRVDAKDLSIQVMEKETSISNGLAFTADGKKFFWTDLLTFTVWQYDYDHATNTLSNKKPLLDTRSVYTDFESPEPDGLSMTKDGTFFQAVFSTSSVLQYDQTGSAVRKFQLPAQRVTCTATGGSSDNDLFITTAHAELMDSNYKFDANEKSGDLGGFLFRVKLDGQVNSKPKDIWGGKLH